MDSRDHLRLLFASLALSLLLPASAGAFTGTYTGGAPNFCLPGIDSFDWGDCYNSNFTVAQASISALAAQQSSAASSTTTLYAQLNSTAAALTVETSRALAAESVLSASTSSLLGVINSTASALTVETNRATAAEATKAPLTGGGTSGTWPISVTGNAGTVTTNANTDVSSHTFKAQVEIDSGTYYSVAHSTIMAADLSISSPGATAPAAELYGGDAYFPGYIGIGMAPDNNNTLAVLGQAYINGTLKLNNNGENQIDLNNVGSGWGKIGNPIDTVWCSGWSASAGVTLGSNVLCWTKGAAVGVNTQSPTAQFEVASSTTPSSYVVKVSSQDGTAMLGVHGNGSMDLKSGITASSGTFTATGAGQYSITTSSGINIGGTGCINFGSNGSQCSPASGGGSWNGGTVTNQVTFSSGVVMSTFSCVTIGAGAYTTTQTSGLVSVTGSTISFVTAQSNSRVLVTASGTSDCGGTACQPGYGFIVDGAYPTGLSKTTAAFIANNNGSNGQGGLAFSWMVTGLSQGSHTFSLVAWTPGGNSLRLGSNSTTNGAVIFCAEEHH